MKRYYMDWPYEKAVEDKDGEWCKYSDVVALESQLQEAQAENADKERYTIELYSQTKSAEDKVKEMDSVMASSTRILLAKIDELEAENAELRSKLEQSREVLRGYEHLSHELLEINKENAELRADNAVLRNCDNCKWDDLQDSPGKDKQCKTCDPYLTIWESNVKNKTDSLLQELTRLRNIVDINGICLTCGGIGEVTFETGQTPEHYECENITCYECNGTGGKEYARLLQELEALRAIKTAAQTIINYIDIECDGECQDLEYMKLEQGLRNTLAAAKGE